jgi:hypothetical protein
MSWVERGEVCVDWSQYREFQTDAESIPALIFTEPNNHSNDACSFYIYTVGDRGNAILAGASREVVHGLVSGNNCRFFWTPEKYWFRT